MVNNGLIAHAELIDGEWGEKDLVTRRIMAVDLLPDEIVVRHGFFIAGKRGFEAYENIELFFVIGRGIGRFAQILNPLNIVNIIISQGVILGEFDRFFVIRFLGDWFFTQPREGRIIDSLIVFILIGNAIAGEQTLIVTAGTV